MNWNRMLIGLGVAVVVGLAASMFVYRRIEGLSTAKPLPTNQVVVAAQNLPLGTRLQPENLRLVSWPAGNLPQGVCTRLEDCVNRALITPVVQDEPILEAKLAPKEGGVGLSATIPEGKRGISVQVNEVIGVAGFVLPGTMVDVLATGSVEGVGSGNSITRTILENIRVLASGQKIQQDKDGKPQTVTVITLLVTPEEADKLTMASTQGKIQLALRNTLDTEKVDPPPVYQASLFAGPAPPPRRGPVARPAPAPAPAPYAMEVIRGAKREVTTFANQ